jgi:hypothetical protein
LPTNEAAMPVWWREKLVVTATEFIWEREKGVLMLQGYDTKLRMSRRLNLLISQSFSIYMCRAIYNSKSRDYNTKVVPIIFSIYIHSIINISLRFYLEMQFNSLFNLFLD